MVKWQRALYQPGVPLGENGTRVTASKEHRELSKEAAKEGMVLLKNEQNLLPLEKGSKVALFGKATFGLCQRWRRKRRCDRILCEESL